MGTFPGVSFEQIKSYITRVIHVDTADKISIIDEIDYAVFSSGS